jgi:hypothetical protein
LVVGVYRVHLEGAEFAPFVYEKKETDDVLVREMVASDHGNTSDLSS